jgi:hypothetical protein
LAISHDFRLEILRVVFSDLVDVFLPLRLAIVWNITPRLAYDEFSGLFKLGSITLSFPGTASCQEDVFRLVVHIFLPMRQPSDRAVVLDL